MTDVTCPSCGTVTQIEEFRREASEFCRKCDYPLFWARSGPVAGSPTDEAGIGLRRLPGTTGKVALAALTCPECSEPNEVIVTHCLRCGADLDPAPPIEEAPPPPPPPPPEPAPEPPQEIRWWVIALVVAVLVGVTVYAVLA